MRYEQLDIFDFIEKPKSLLEKVMYKIKDPVVPCVNCLCKYCVNNVEELWRKVKVHEQKFPCFACDECSVFTGEAIHKCQCREECDKFEISDFGAQRNRKKYFVNKGN